MGKKVNISKEEKETEPYISEFSKNIANKIRILIREKGINQTQIVEKCKDNGLYISQGTISHAINSPESITFSTLLKICFGLDINVCELFSDIKNDENNYISNSDLLIRNPFDSAFRGYLGKYYVYFYQTRGKNENLIKGVLEFGASKDKTRCEAKFRLPTGKFKRENEKIKEIVKEYQGELIISISMRSAYCFLCSDNEICLLIFSHWHLLNEHLRCAMASAVTTSSGSDRRPTLHRMCISRTFIEEKDLKYIKGQLLLNDSDILISEDKLENLKNDEALSQEFLMLLENSLKEEKYYSVPEASLVSDDMSEDKFAKEISLLRTYSTAAKYNKISAQTNNLLFTLINDIDEEFPE